MKLVSTSWPPQGTIAALFFLCVSRARGVRLVLRQGIAYRWRPGAAVLTLLLSAFLLPNTAFAGVGDFTPATWNMQGATEDNESKWATKVKPLVTGATDASRAHNVIALQEAGARPGSATWFQNWTINGVTINEYLWPITTTTYAYVYHMEVPGNTAGARTNMAFVSERAATQVYIVPQQPNAAGALGPRPALGVEINPGNGGPSTIFWNVHAGAHQNNDAQNMVNAIAAASAGNSYAILGDFNLEPTGQAGLAPPAGSYVYHTNQQTQQGGRVLDYMVASDAVQGWGGHLTGIHSDHVAVDFGLGGAGAGADIALKLRDPGKCVAVAGGGRSNGTALQLWNCNGASEQIWTFEIDGTVRSMGKCMDVQGAGTASGTAVQLWDCTADNPAQQWRAQYDGALMNPNSKKCLNVSMAGGAINGTSLSIGDCGDTADNRWTIPVTEGHLASRSFSQWCADAGASIYNGASILLSKCEWVAGQILSWLINNQIRIEGKCATAVPGGSWRLDAAPNTALHVSAAGVTDEVGVQLWDCQDGDPNQQWLAGENGSVFNPQSGKCLDFNASANANANATQLELRTCDFGPNQQWARENVVVYEHGWYFGRKQELAPGKYDLTQLSVGNDVISSLRLPLGWTVMLYEHEHFQGRRKLVTADMPAVSSDFDDITSSVIVTAPPIANETYRLFNPNSGKVLDNIGCSTANGTRTKIWDDSDSPCQRWSLVPVADDTYENVYKLINSNSGKSLDVSGCGTANGTPVQIWDDLNRNGSISVCQRWTISASADGTYKLRNPYIGKVLDVSGCGTVNGTTVQIRHDDDSACQKWLLIKADTVVRPAHIANGTYRLINPSSSKVLNVSGCSAANGTKTQVWDDFLTSCQKWNFVQVADDNYQNVYKLINSKSGKSLNVRNCGTLNGTPVQIWDDLNRNGSINVCQRWTISEHGDGTYKLRNPYIGKALDVSGCGTVNGTTVQIWDDVDNACQRWQIIKAD